MKNVFLGIAVTVSGVLFVLIVMTVSGTAIRKNELQNSVEIALLSTLENGFCQNNYPVADEEELCADFIQTLLMQIESKGEIEVRILEANAEKGLLSAEVTEHYRHPIGTEGCIRVQRTVMMEQYKEE